ncbi:DUF6602 domain-containing protein [Chryseobacterium culicis]|uniref:DUF6602 domain-containing protein n=1 Tax=Chryseobacterium culicis TaxID=680127 RepID=UPI00289D49A9|nr:DUF6602 domain-containing protein [Chryseobacterium culicis]
MSDQTPKLKIQVPTQGWKQFLIARDEMLSAYDRARELSRKRDVQTGHGVVAEAEFRKWLSNFLPKRYGVTSGYIISPGMPNSENFVHYDVIIYDQLESPILWVDDSSDSSAQGRSLAIPVEYVRGIIEVKSAFNKQSAKKAVEQLAKLKPLLANVEPKEHPLKLHLPANFFCATVFFELREKDEKDFAALDELIEAAALRGFYGGFILRTETLGKYYSGKLSFLQENSDVVPDNKSLSYWATSKCKKLANRYYKIQLDHFESYFSEFAFDLIALLKGTYNPNILSSLYGMGSTQWEKSAVDVRYYCPEDVKRYNEEIDRYFKNL